MIVLALDTSTMISSCAVLDEEQVLGEYSLNQNETHSENLVPMIKEVLENLDLKVEDIDLYGVAIGPGSFTGLRIGVATVKALAHVFDKPVVGVSTLEALAYNLPNHKIIVPMIDARRDRVYTGIYTWQDGRIKTIMEPTVLEIDKLLDILEGYDELIVNGNGSVIHKEKINDRLKGKVRFSTMGNNFCRAISVGELALIKYKGGYVDNFYSLVPEYLKESQAQADLKKKEQR
ncbi:MAG TPA: tRNA (adenosine(37)-N6)-threonylcarbamoyltransferase complex dimerization subunit type 1 TsaB [Tissierellaceae bacterium]